MKAGIEGIGFGKEHFNQLFKKNAENLIKKSPMRQMDI
jgi:hypothetical protein